jgi:hypothetical protein
MQRETSSFTSEPTRRIASVNRCMMLRSSMIAGRSASNGCWYLEAEHQRDAFDVSCPTMGQFDSRLTTMTWQTSSSLPASDAFPVSRDVLPSIIEQIIQVRRRLSNSRSCRSSRVLTFESRFSPSSMASLKQSHQGLVI